MCVNKNHHHNHYNNHQQDHWILSLSLRSCIVLFEMFIRPPSLKRRQELLHYPLNNPYIITLHWESENMNQAPLGNADLAHKYTDHAFTWVCMQWSRNRASCQKKSTGVCACSGTSKKYECLAQKENTLDIWQDFLVFTPEICCCLCTCTQEQKASIGSYPTKVVCQMAKNLHTLYTPP